MHQALYRKWRPQSFSEVCGQEHITDILKYEVQNKLVSHAYLFCGSRGTGKTTCAKILARAVNCENPVDGNPCGVCAACRSIQDGSATDVLEMDAASNNKVDDIRTILDEVIYTPSALKYRVYIVDEVHMLTTSAFNALLKTLEEPPAHVIFILATTEMQKLPATVISRCQRFDFHRIPASVLTSRLKFIAKEENIELDDDAALIIARLAAGGMRDAISLFELCAAGGNKVDAAKVSDTVGFSGRGPVSSVVRAIISRDCPALFRIIAETDASSRDLGVFWQELISYYRDMLVMKTAGRENAIKYLDLTDAEADMIAADAGAMSLERISFQSRMLDEAYSSMQRPGANRRTVAEMALVRLSDDRLNTSCEGLLARIEALEAKLVSGNFAPVTAVPAASTAPAVSVNIPAAADKTAQPAAAPVAQPCAAAQPAAELKRMRRWTEVVDLLRKTGPGAASLLGSATAFDDGVKIHIKYSNILCARICSAPETLAKICTAIGEVTERPVSPAQVVFEEGTEEELKPDNGDELSASLEKMIK